MFQPFQRVVKQFQCSHRTQLTMLIGKIFILLHADPVDSNNTTIWANANLHIPCNFVLSFTSKTNWCYILSFFFQLCLHCWLLPEMYLLCKEAMTTEFAKSGRLRLMDACQLCQIYVNKTRKIYNLLVSRGLIS